MSGGYPPMPGSPDVVEGLAAGLRAEAQRVASAQERLLALRHGSRWDSPAGRAFAAEVAALPPVLDAVAQRYAGAAAALREFACVFREAQQECNLAITLRERGLLRRDRYLEALGRAETSELPQEQARVPELQRLMVEAAGEVLDNERRWCAARKRFDEADRRCSRILGGLVHDSLTDSLRYDTVKGAARLSDSVSANATYAALVPTWRPVAVAVGATATAGRFLLDGVVKVAYDEGEWSTLAEEASLDAVGFTTGALRTGALARGLSGRTQGPVGFSSAGDRLRHGLAAEARDSVPWRVRPAPKATMPPNPPPNLLQGAAPGTAPGAARPLPLRQRVRAAARERAMRPVRAVRADWASATRSGADARTMLLTAWGLKAGTTAYTRGKQVDEAWEKAQERSRARAATARP
ncbi:hypothetical protein [Phycicoccus sp. SLBN-51]|uniref:hypothetical protein n=1 Tax=Phycicoccus sp. SLBN-51 TaxID=2768447 RepID=UPI00116B1F41|nr:hypothetical protein [Phycicoccus sp. SLBN-51]TQJ50264.1 hypothetical protein FBY26_1964 [Phycicoccus sp. SLBN-51]